MTIKLVLYRNEKTKQCFVRDEKSINPQFKIQHPDWKSSTIREFPQDEMTDKIKIKMSYDRKVIKKVMKGIGYESVQVDWSLNNPFVRSLLGTQTLTIDIKEAI